MSLLAAGMAGSAFAQTGGQGGSEGAGPPSSQTTTEDATSKPSTTPDTMSKQASRGTLASGDRRFVTKAATESMLEVQLSQMAQEKASNDQVKHFASHVTEDQTKADDQLKQIASNKGANLPAAVNKSQQKDIDKLQKLSGAAFDSEYMKKMVAAQKADVKDFQREAKGGKDGDLKSFASTTLPTMQGT